MSRQAWYQAMAQAEEDDLGEGILLDEVLRIRARLPGCGAEKLHFLLQKEGVYEHWGIKCGRDRLAALLARHGLLAVKRRARARTTNSMHSYRKHPNLAKDVAVSATNQVWVADITYLPVGGSFGYLSMVTDAHSRKVVGWALSRDLTVKGPLGALEMAIAGAKGPLGRLLHHSDRGVQYCCGAYVKLLKKHKIGISMTLNGDPNENALAERMNRTIKGEMLQDRGFTNHPAAEMGLRTAIGEYNGYRPHASLDFLTPRHVHASNGPAPRKRWKKRTFHGSGREGKKETTTTNTNAAKGGVQSHEPAGNSNFFSPILRQPISG